jgi:hypothetical protein
MDASNKKVSIIAETTQGTTPATPTFLVLRDQTTTGGLSAPWGESPERRNDRMLGTTVKQQHQLGKVITMPLFTDEAAVHVLLASFMCGDWATDALINGSKLNPYTVEEVYEAATAAPGPWFWAAGNVVDQLDLSLQNGQPGQWTFTSVGMTETTGAAAITGATYTPPGSDEPVTPIDVTVNSFFGLGTLPKMMNLRLTGKNNIRRGYTWGSPDAYRTGLGSFRVDATVDMYFSSLTEYTTFSPGALGELDITIGSVGGHKLQLILPNCKISNPTLSDGGNDSDVTLSCTLNATYDGTTGAAMKLVRKVA